MQTGPENSPELKRFDAAPVTETFSTMSVAPTAENRLARIGARIAHKLPHLSADDAATVSTALAPYPTESGLVKRVINQLANGTLTPTEVDAASKLSVQRSFRRVEDRTTGALVKVSPEKAFVSLLNIKEKHGPALGAALDVAVEMAEMRTAAVHVVKRALAIIELSNSSALTLGDFDAAKQRALLQEAMKIKSIRDEMKQHGLPQMTDDEIVKLYFACSRSQTLVEQFFEQTDGIDITKKDVLRFIRAVTSGAVGFDQAMKSLIAPQQQDNAQRALLDPYSFDRDHDNAASEARRIREVE